ncbi:DMT family transporter [Streptomyces sp. NPDC001978]|uniref:DMT family transporter n=1 Tax=Streptomyces sp. NPDC001978 TaxID=3364627 RepID=UPI00368C878E
MPYASVLLALLAAVLFAVSVNLQQHVARGSALESGSTPPRAPAKERPWLPVLGLLRRLVRDPAWLAGWGLNVLGFAAHVVALHLGAITAVQAILVVQLMFAVMLNAARRGIRPMPRDWLATGSVCVGVILLVLQRAPVRQVVPDRSAVLAFLAVMAGLLALLLALARRPGRAAQTRAALVATGAGLCFCVTAVLVVVVTHDLATGPRAALDWPLAVLVVSPVTGSLLVQDSFASGSLPTSLTAMTISDPVASAVAGALLFDAAPPSGLQLVVGLPAAVLLIATGVVLLANSSTLHDERDHAPGASALA